MSGNLCQLAVRLPHSSRMHGAVMIPCMVWSLKWGPCLHGVVTEVGPMHARLVWSLKWGPCMHAVGDCFSTNGVSEDMTRHRPPYSCGIPMKTCLHVPSLASETVCGPVATWRIPLVGADVYMHGCTGTTGRLMHACVEPTRWKMHAVLHHTVSPHHPRWGWSCHIHMGMVHAADPPGGQCMY